MCIAGHPAAYTERSSKVRFLGNPNQLWEGQPWPILLCVNSFSHFIQPPREYYDHEDLDQENLLLLDCCLSYAAFVLLNIQLQTFLSVYYIQTPVK